MLARQGTGQTSLPQTERLAPAQHLTAVCSAAQLLANAAAQSGDGSDAGQTVASRRSAFGRVRQLAASAADMLQRCRAGCAAEPPLDAGCTLLAVAAADGYAEAARLSYLIDLQGTRPSLGTLQTQKVCFVVALRGASHGITCLQGIDSCTYAGDWRLAARVSAPPASRLQCCCTCAVLSPHAPEHVRLKDLSAATEAAREQRSDSEAQPSERIRLHLAAAEAHRRAADLTTAQWHSYEALRLSMQSPRMVYCQSVGGQRDHGSESGGAWQAAGLRLAALLQGGQLCEVAGSPEEALDAFKQAMKLVRSQPADARFQPQQGCPCGNGSGRKHGCFSDNLAF